MKIWKGCWTGLSENIERLHGGVSGLLLKSTFGPEGHIQPIKIHEMIQMLIIMELSRVLIQDLP